MDSFRGAIAACSRRAVEVAAKPRSTRLSGRVRNEADILRDTLDHMAAFCDGGIWVYDDLSEDGSAEIGEANPA